jgi:predicted GNAT superfamily acetyltransferase
MAKASMAEDSRALLEAREAARQAAADAGVELRALTTLEEAQQALEVVAATWGTTQAIGHEILRAFQASGNVLIGAYQDDRMVGVVLGFYGHDHSGWHHHSHMLAALPDRRHRGVGYALKLAQRAAVLEAGVSMARWTFDPLVARNAHFNLVKLGAVADRFHRAFYGEMADDINRGDRSDRLEVRWDLSTAPGGSSGREGAGGTGPGGDPGRYPVVLSRVGDEDLPRPGAVVPPDGPGGVVEIPADLAALRLADPAVAAAWRDAVAEAMESCFGAGPGGHRFPFRVAVRLH